MKNIRYGAMRRRWQIMCLLPWLGLVGCASTGDAVNGASGTGSMADVATSTSATTQTPTSSAEAAANDSGAAAHTAAKNGGAAGAGDNAAGAPPFAKVIKDAKPIEGFMRMYRKDDKVWLELAPADFDKLFYLKSNLDRGIGENRLYGGMMTYPAGVEGVVQFRQVGRTVQMLEKNMNYTARAGTPEALAVARSFSDSLLASAPIASAPHPERGSILVEVNALFVNDMPAAAHQLEQTYRQSYAFDARNSYLANVRSADELLVFEVNAHYALSRIAMPPMGGRGEGEPSPMPGGSMPTLPSVLPDVRSLFLGFQYSLAPLPGTPMATRRADERVGYFLTEQLDFTANDARLPIVRNIYRWRLEKQDPTAALSEPKTPIVYWLDRTIPERYRQPIIEGVLEWNKAFEKIGFKNAIRAEIEPADATFSTSDLRRPSIRWLTTAKPSFGGIGPSVVDPRTGEILDADIGLDASQVRAVAAVFGESIEGPEVMPEAMGLAAGRAFSSAVSAEMCMAGLTAMQEAQFGMALLALREEAGDGVLQGSAQESTQDNIPHTGGRDRVRGDAQTQRFVFNYLKYVTMHEVGHTLGLRHNFHASTIYNEQQLSDEAFTKTHGIAGSVMEYLPWNLALPGKQQGDYQMTTLGPYDYWAIAYGYSAWPEGEEDAALSRLAQQGLENPELVYATDEDASPQALDPEVNTQDLGSDTLAYAKKRMALSKELWARTQQAVLPEGASYSVLRRNFTRGLQGAQEASVFATRYIGGARLRAARAGDAVSPLTPVSAAQQRDALRFLAREMLSANSVVLSPSFLRNLAAGAFDRQNAQTLGAPRLTADLAVDQTILDLHKKILEPLMSARTAQRLLNNMAKSEPGEDALTLGELYSTVHRALWSELKGNADIPLVRRNVQREYAQRLVGPLLSGASAYPADARALMRQEAATLKSEIEARQKRVPGAGRQSAETRAHLEEVRMLLTQALQASMVRAAP